MRYLIDGAALVLVLVNVALGWRCGLIRRGIGVAGLFGGLAVATLMGNPLADLVYGSGKSTSLYADAWAFVAVTAAVVVAVEVLSVLYGEKLRLIASMMFDRSAGAVVGAGLGLLEIGVCCVVGLSVGSASAQASTPLPAGRSLVGAEVRASVAGGQANRAENGLLDLFRPVLPQDLPGHLAGNAQVGVAAR